MAYLSGFEVAAPTLSASAGDTADEAHASIRLLQLACSNRAIRRALESLLRQPREQRRHLVEVWASEMRAHNASTELVHAIASLAHDEVAARASDSLFGAP